jgi:xanthine dehydrogenase molybdenum-binding subunit
MSVVGQSVPRLDAVPKVVGSARYTVDVALPGMLVTRFVRSPYPHASVVKIDVDSARRVPGVVHILTRDNSSRRFYTDNGTSRLNLMPRPAVEDQRLFDDVVRYAGEPVALVAADSVEAAEAAAELVEVEYEALDAVFEPFAAMADHAPQIHPFATGNRASYLPMQTGDIEAGFAEAAVVVEHTFQTSRQKHCQMEPHGCVASYEDERLTIWSPTQAAHLVKQQLAELFDLPHHRVRVINPHIGGGFGSTVGFVVEAWACAMALTTRRPVRVVLSREEDFAATSFRHPMHITFRAGFAADGRPTAMDARFVSDTGAYATCGPGVMGALAHVLYRLYPCANTRLEGITVYTNTPPAGGFRGYGGPQAFFALEQIIDMAAERLGLDSVELRKRISIRPGDIDPTLRTPLATSALQACLDHGAERIGWYAGSLVSRATGTLRRGKGVGAVMWISGTGCMASPLDAAGAIVAIERDGSAILTSGACDCGTGAKTSLVQIVADELGLPYHQVAFGPSDTASTPFESGAHASRTLYGSGLAAQLAAADVRRQVLDQAAQMLETSPADLLIEDGEVRVRGVPERRVTVAAVADNAYRHARQFIGTGQTPEVNDPPFAAQFVEVEVDTETGVVRVLRVVSAHDIGTAINPAVVEGQIEGSIQQGVGYALTENLPIDMETGSVLATTFADYRMLTTETMPEIEIVLVEDAPAANGPFGAKGIGEPGLISTAAAIANAVYDAIGVRITELPITPERVLEALRASDPLPIEVGVAAER